MFLLSQEALSLYHTGHFDLAGNYETLVFPRQEMFDITESILEDEGIRYQFSKELAPAWEPKSGTDRDVK